MVSATTSDQLRLFNQVRMLRAVHDGGAGLTRAELTRLLGVGRGTASTLVGELTAARLVAEVRPAHAQRGRPTLVLGPHPQGPLVLIVDLKEDGWRLYRAELGGEVSRRCEAAHSGDPTGAFDAVREALGSVLDDRVQGIVVSVPGLVEAGRYVHVAHLNWGRLDLRRCVEAAWPALLVLNDARLAGLGEARRGALRGISTALHFHIDFDLGGTLLVDGRSQEGGLGLAGEFGHMPLTGSESPCMCGLRGCWGQEVGLNALARGAGGETGFGRGRAEAAAVLERARGGDRRALGAVRECARALGKGMGYFANACDPERIALSGVGIELLALAEEEVRRSLEDSQMLFRRRLEVPVVAGELGPSGMVVGAMEAAFDRFLTPDGLRQWLSGR